MSFVPSVVGLASSFLYGKGHTLRLCKSCKKFQVKAEQSRPKYSGNTRKGFQTTSLKGHRSEWKQENNVETIDRTNLSVPPIVSERMGKRMLYAASVPLTFFVLLFGSLFVAKFQFDITFMPSVVAYSSLLLIFCTMAALSYGILSASWDVEDEGSFWGWKEFRINIGRTVQGFKAGARK
jgi:hypothetical protein